MNILITGGAGFIGSHTFDVLKNKGHKITIVDNLSTGSLNNLTNEGDVVFHKTDINCLPELAKHFKNGNFDAVYHFAAQMNVRKSVDEPDIDAYTNIIGSLNVFRCCKDYGVRNVIFSSSGGTVYGEANLYPTPISHPTLPICPYGISKLSAEHYANYYRSTFGLKIIVLRYGNVYGERQNPKSEAGVISIFMEQMVNGKTPIIFGNGEQTRDYIYVGDVAKINYKMLMSDQFLNSSKNKLDWTFNVGTGKETNVNRLFDYINDLTGNKLVKKYSEAKLGELQRSCLKCTETNRLLDLDPGQMITIKDGLRMSLKNQMGGFRNG